MSRRGIVLGRERAYDDVVTKKPRQFDRGPTFPALKLPKNNVGRQRPRSLRWRSTPGSGELLLEVIHPEKAAKYHCFALRDLHELCVYDKERRIRFVLKEGDELEWRFQFPSHDPTLDYEAFVALLTQLQVPFQQHANRARSSMLLPTPLEVPESMEVRVPQQRWLRSSAEVENNPRQVKLSSEHHLECVISWDEPLKGPGGEEYAHSRAVRLTVDFSNQCREILQLAARHIFAGYVDPPALFDLELVRIRASGAGQFETIPLPLETRLDTFHTSALGFLQLRRRLEAPKRCSGDGDGQSRTTLKVLIPELHSSKIVPLLDTVSISQAIAELYQHSSLLNSLIPADSLLYYSLFHEGDPLNSAKSLREYYLTSGDVVSLNRPPLYEFAQDSQTKRLVIPADSTVGDAVRALVAWVEPPLFGHWKQYGLMVASTLKRMSEARRAWLCNTDLLSMHKLEANQTIFLQSREKRSNNPYDLQPRPLRVISVPATTHCSDVADQVRRLGTTPTFFQCALSNENGKQVLHIPDGGKETLLFSERVQEIIAAQVSAPKKLGAVINGELILTNYQLLWIAPDTINRIPLGLIERIERTMPPSVPGRTGTDASSNRIALLVECKTPLQYTFYVQSEYAAFVDTLIKLAYSAVFAFEYKEKFENVLEGEEVLRDIMCDFERQGLSSSRHWRFSFANRRYQLSSTYPHRLFVPKSIDDELLEEVAHFRSKGRLPALTYLHPSGNSLSRASQPLVGLQNRRSAADERMLEAIRDSSGSGRLIVYDARPKINAMANQAKGAGYESAKGYPGCELKFLDIDNIHAVRNSYRAIRTMSWSLDSKNVEGAKSSSGMWHSVLANSRWFEFLRLILRGSVKAAMSIHRDNSSVLVHCSDGWDRTAQLVSLTQIMLDPYYRTVVGFEVLIEKDWLLFGHRFERRFGHANKNHSDEQRAPIFFQFLDCVYQMMRQFPRAFEFNSRFLVHIAHHTVDLRFGTFLYDCQEARRQKKLKHNTVSLWAFLNNNYQLYQNMFYQPPPSESRDDQVIIPSYSLSHLALWEDFFLQNSLDHLDVTDRYDACAAQARKWKAEGDELRKEVLELRRQLASQRQTSEDAIVIDFGYSPSGTPNTSASSHKRIGRRVRAGNFGSFLAPYHCVVQRTTYEENIE